MDPIKSALLRLIRTAYASFPEGDLPPALRAAVEDAESALRTAQPADRPQAARTAHG